MIALDSKFENDTFMVLVQLDDGTKWIKFSNESVAEIEMFLVTSGEKLNFENEQPYIPPVYATLSNRVC